MEFFGALGLLIVLAALLSALIWAISRLVWGKNEALFPAVFGAAVVFAIASCLLDLFVVPAIHEVFVSFINLQDLPFQTRVVFARHYFLWFPLLLMPAIWLGCRRWPVLRVRIASIALLFEVCLVVFALWGLYSPTICSPTFI